jgi:hypothetical protein
MKADRTSGKNKRKSMQVDVEPINKTTPFAKFFLGDQLCAKS